jgi:hypothetical protein
MQSGSLLFEPSKLAVAELGINCRGAILLQRGLQMESVGELTEVARTANWRRGGDEWLMASDGGRQAANSGIPMCYYCCLSRQGQKKPIHNIISIREGT